MLPINGCCRIDAKQKSACEAGSGHCTHKESGGAHAAWEGGCKDASNQRDERMAMAGHAWHGSPTPAAVLRLTALAQYAAVLRGGARCRKGPTCDSKRGGMRTW